MSGALGQPSMLVDLAGKLAPMASLVLYMAPLPTIQKITKEQDVGDLPLLPYSSMAVSGFLWTTYGVLKSQVSVWSPNATGMLLAIFYSIQFARFAPAAAPTLPGSLNQHRDGALIIGSTALLAAAAHSTELVGFMCVGICLALFGSPLAALKTVLTSKSAESIPLPLSLATTVNCFLWTVVGLFDMHDMNVIIPNGIGFILGMVQLCLKYIYGDRPAKLVPEVSIPEAFMMEKNQLLEQTFAFVGPASLQGDEGEIPVPEQLSQEERNQGLVRRDNNQGQAFRHRVGLV